MTNKVALIKKRNRLINDLQYANAHAFYHKNLYEKFTEQAAKYEQDLKDVECELKTNINGVSKMTFEDFRELFYTTDDKANIFIDVLYKNNKPYYPEGTFRVIDKELDKYNNYYVIGLIQLVDEIGVVLADRGDINA